MIGIVSGLLTGMVLFLISMVTQVYLFRQIDAFRRMGVKGLLENRHDKQYYSPLMSNAQMSVKVMGSSASRFLADFLDGEADTHVLLDRLRSDSQFSVKILIPSDIHLSDSSKRNWRNKSSLVAALTSEFGGRFEVRRFNETAHHSFIVIDDDSDFVGGPVLDTESRHGPAVHVSGTTAYAQKHNKYFNKIWDQLG